jgi:hypothetical protein
MLLPSLREGSSLGAVIGKPRLDGRTSDWHTPPSAEAAPVRAGQIGWAPRTRSKIPLG